MPGADTLILHQYDVSPFSEKVRVLLGVKGAAWAACGQPVIMPKPDLTPLTGGYRRIPVLQVGADVYLDSRCIAAELERRCGGRSLYGAGQRGAAEALAWFGDRTLFQLTVLVVFGATGFKVDEAFVRDREALSGRPFDAAAMAAMAPYAAAQLRAHLAGLDAQLSDGEAFLLGPEPTLADAGVFHNLAFLRWAAPHGLALLDGLDALLAWETRVRGLGHGERSEIAPAEALALARAAEPAPLGSQVAPPAGLRLGDQVQAAADDYGRDPVVGELVGLEHDRISLRRETPELGALHVHLPRAGFVLSAA